MSEYEQRERGLAYEPSAQKNIESEVGSREKSAAEIERDIELTRSRMSRDIDELGDRLSTGNLKQEAKSVIREQARKTGSRVADAIRENPLPVIAVGAGVTWLLTRRSGSDVSGDRMARYAYTGPERRQSWQSGSGIKERVGEAVSGVKDSVSGVKETVSEAASGIAERAGEIASDTQERLGEFGGQARRQTDRIKTSLEQASDENPLFVALGAAVVGLALGLILPRTERENEIMGSARDQLMDRAGRTAERVKDVAAEAGREVKETVRSEIKEHAPEVKQVARQVKEQVEEQVKESAKRAKSEAKDAVRDAGTRSKPGSQA